MQDTDLQEDIRLVLECGPIKVWSVVVTVLGDLCRDPGDRIAGRVLNHLVERLGINNQALRVALHRLRRDGWIETEREGRMSNYLLSARGWEMTQAARGAVYGGAPEPRPVHVLVAPPSGTAAEFAELLPDEAVILSPRSALCAGGEDLPDECLQARLVPGNLPDWVAEALAGAELCAEYQRLADRVAAVLDRPAPAGLADRLALRLVILHHWRRLRLRHGDLPDMLLPDDWAGARARAQVMVALERFGRPEATVLRDPARFEG